MAKLLIGGCGGPASENVILSWKKSCENDVIVGIGADPYDMVLSQADIKYQVPVANDPKYKERLLWILDKEKPDMAHFQVDGEILVISRIREEFEKRGIKLFIADKETIETCVNKGKTAIIWKNSDIKVPDSMPINTQEDLKTAFAHLGNETGTIWLRSTEPAGGGRGAVPTNNFDFAKLWIDRFNGWGTFQAAELLTEKTVTWMSIWYKGELVVAQTRKRKSWTMGNRTLSGVTGVTHVGETYSSDEVTKISQNAIFAVTKQPHGIFAVDLTYDKDGIPNPTEINISRFFTTVRFFTEAGLNMPAIYRDLALYEKYPVLERKINPLPDHLLWIRGMDRVPVLTTSGEIEKTINLIEGRPHE